MGDFRQSQPVQAALFDAVILLHMHALCQNITLVLAFKIKSDEGTAEVEVNTVNLTDMGRKNP